MGPDILKVLEEIKAWRMVSGATNATFIALILKSSHIDSYNDFLPISLCNMIYKLNAKTIANRMSKSLSLGISKAQFSFLSN